MAKAERAIGQFGQIMNDRMLETGITIRDLAARLDATYEYIRRLARGQSPPSRLFLRNLCDILQLDYPKMQQVVVADQLRKKYGGIPAILAGKNPKVEPFEQIIPYLNEEQVDTLLDLAHSFKERNRKESGVEARKR